MRSPENVWWIFVPFLSACMVNGQSQCNADFDLVFIVDSSGSIRDNNPEPNLPPDSPLDNYNLLKQFMKRIVNFLDISTSDLFGVQIGIVTFGNRGKVELELTGDLDVLTDAIDNLPYQGGNTNTSGGLFKAREQVLANENTNRAGVQDAILIVTDGIATVDINLTLPYVEQLQNDGVRLFAVGITEAAQEDRVRELTSPNDNGEQLEEEAYWLLPDFDTINDVVDGIAEVICTVILDLCSSDPCQNNAVCVNQLNNFTCVCPLGFYGYLCQYNYCDDHLCVNEGTCVQRIDGYQCACPFGFAGDYCEIDYCENHSCVNGGTCVWQLDGYQCVCPVGFVGDFCQIDYCQNHNCVNGGTCTREIDGYYCTCPVGFAGDFCQIDYCENRCFNGATCLRFLEGVSCSCLAGFGGEFCQTDFCLNNPCLNGGQCIGIANGYECECINNFFGDHCEFFTTTAPTTVLTITQQAAGAAAATNNNSDSNDYLIAIIVILILLIGLVIALIFLCCFWTRIKAMCCPSKTYIASREPVLEDKGEVVTRSTQCDPPKEKPKQTHKESLVIVAKCTACGHPEDNCQCAPTCPPCCRVCNQPNCCGQQCGGMVAHHYDLHVPKCNASFCNGCPVCDGCTVTCPRCQTGGCRGCYIDSGLASASMSSLRSASAVKPTLRPATLSYETYSPSRTRKNMGNKSRSRRMRARTSAGGLSDASTSSKAKLVSSDSSSQHFGATNSAYISDVSDREYMSTPKRSLRKNKRFGKNKLDESFNSRVSAGK